MTSTWCAECQLLLEEKDMGYHTSHRAVNLGGYSRDETITGLDGIIQYGQQSIESVKNELELARKVNDDIEATKLKFKNTLRERIEKIVHDLRVTLDDHSMQLLADVDMKYERIQSNAQAVIKSSRYKMDTANAFMKKAILLLPDENGNLDRDEVLELTAAFANLEKINTLPKPDLKQIQVNIKYPNTMKMKVHCQGLAKQIVGEIVEDDAISKRKMFKNMGSVSVDVVDISCISERKIEENE